LSDTHYVSRVEIEGLHGSTNLDLSLRPGLNIIFGKNGAGKTTLLHILANLLDGDIERFTYLRFAEIRVHASSGSILKLARYFKESTSVIGVTLNDELIDEVGRNGRPHDATRKLLRELGQGRPVYLPAFRSVLEAISRDRPVRYASERYEKQLQAIREAESGSEDSPDLAIAPRVWRRERRVEGVAYKTLLCREWFGEFVPIVRFPSLAEVADELREEYQSAELEVAHRDRMAFSDVFVEVVRTVFDRADGATSEDTTAILASIRSNLESLQERSFGVGTVYDRLAKLMADQQDVPDAQEVMASRILRLYDAALRRRIRAQRETFRQIRTFETSVNRFLQNKTLKVGGEAPADARRRGPRIRWQDGREAHLPVLSSGERHVLTLLFSATHMPATRGVFLLDEPELSLHVDWQRIILRELMEQVGSRQIVACTHAPEIAADHHEAMIRLASRRHVDPQPDLFDPTQRKGHE
jgi:predicted ATPase